MHKVNHNFTQAQRRKLRTRKKLFGAADQPRVSVRRTNQHIYVQIIDDRAGKTLATSNDLDLEKSEQPVTKTEKAKLVASDLSSKLKSLKISKAVFDRGGYRYHGRVKAVAEVLRENGINI